MKDHRACPVMFLLLTRHDKQRYALMDGRGLDYPALSVPVIFCG
ncbi:hypothetical protein [Aeromonas salmonicida]|nr:hypothetical protein [Aeromonas salmonicida]UUI60093.1 hypothetical protein NP805_18355 [Aeromonas salmonicida]